MHQQPLLAPAFPKSASRSGQRSGVSGRTLSVTRRASRDLPNPPRSRRGFGGTGIRAVGPLWTGRFLLGQDVGGRPIGTGRGAGTGRRCITLTIGTGRVCGTGRGCIALTIGTGRGSGTRRGSDTRGLIGRATGALISCDVRSNDWPCDETADMPCEPSAAMAGRPIAADAKTRAVAIPTNDETRTILMQLPRFYYLHGPERRPAHLLDPLSLTRRAGEYGLRAAGVSFALISSRRSVTLARNARLPQAGRTVNIFLSPGTAGPLAKSGMLGLAWPRQHPVDYLKALLNLNPFLRRRLHAIAHLAGMTELEALTTIVESTPDELIVPERTPTDE